MKINTAGNYTLRYTATDSCGNSSSVDRPLTIAEKRTVLYADGTFIINELPKDRAKNEALHGAVVSTRQTFERPTDYRFENKLQRPWSSVASQITAVEIGQPISPINMQYWFDELVNCESMNLENIDTSGTVDMTNTFRKCQKLTSLNLQHFNTQSCLHMDNMFQSCSVLGTLDISNFNTSSVTSMEYMFNGCRALKTLDLSHFDTSNVTTMSNMFRNCLELEVLDLSSFTVGTNTVIAFMFDLDTKLKTIYASPNFVSPTATGDSSNMFSNMSTNLIGGAGTTWSATNPKDKTYARIDNPPDAPGYFTLKPTA